MGRSPCCEKEGFKKGPWTAEEDMKLIQYIQMHGPGNWRSLPKHAGLQRCGKSCRLRWTNYLRPDIKRGRFSFEEEESIIQLHSALGNKWSAIAARLPGRTDNEIKNYWNTHIRKRLLKMGIDPVTHAPRLDFLDLSSFLSSSQLNLSNLIRLQTLLNPDTLRLAFSLMSSNIENPNSLLQKLQESQFLNSQLQNHQASTFQPNQFENILNQQIPSNLITQSMQQNNGDNLNVNPSEFSNQIFQDSVTNNVATTSENPAISLSNYLNGSDQMKADLSENSSFQSLNSSCSNINSTTQNFGFDSVLSSTPLSSPANLNSGSTFVGGSTEDERESFCSSLLRFEIPQGFDLDNFM